MIWSWLILNWNFAYFFIIIEMWGTLSFLTNTTVLFLRIKKCNRAHKQTSISLEIKKKLNGTHQDDNNILKNSSIWTVSDAKLFDLLLCLSTICSFFLFCRSPSLRSLSHSLTHLSHVKSNVLWEWDTFFLLFDPAWNNEEKITHSHTHARARAYAIEENVKRLAMKWNETRNRNKNRKRRKNQASMYLATN